MLYLLDFAVEYGADMTQQDLFDVWSRETGWRISSRYWLPVIEARGEPGPAFGAADSAKAAMPRRMPPSDRA